MGMEDGPKPGTRRRVFWSDLNPPEPIPGPCPSCGDEIERQRSLIEQLRSDLKRRQPEILEMFNGQNQVDVEDWR